MDPVLQFFKDEKEREGARNQTIDQVVQGFFENTKGELGAPLTKSGQHVFMEMDGHKVFTYEGWKENQEAAVAWTKLAGAALTHLKEGFEKDGGDWSELPVRGTEAAMTTVDSLLELATGAGRFVAKSWRDDEEENEAAYNAYLKMTANFNRRYSGKSFVGDLHRGLGTGAGNEADAMIDPQWADAWGMLLDPVWLIPGGQAAKVSKLMNTGAKGGKLAAAAAKVAQLAKKAPGAVKAGQMVGKFFRAPVSQTAAGTGRVIDGFGKAGTWVGEKAGSSKALGVMAGGAAGVTAFSTLDEADSDWIKWLGSAGAAYGTAKALPWALAKGSSYVSKGGQLIHATAKASEMGLGRAANLGRYSDGLARKMKVIDNAPVNFLLRNSNNLANYAVRGAAFGAGMGYLVAGKEGAASGIGVGLVGGPLGAAQGKAISVANRVSFHKPDGDGGWLRVDAKNILDVPYKDLVTNWMADMPAENRTALAEWAAGRGEGADRILYGMAMVEMFAKGLLTKVDDEKVGDINVLYIRDDDHMAARFPEHPEFQGVAGFQHVDSNGKPFAVVNLQHSKNPLYTLTHEVFHPDWKTTDPENPLTMARAELEGVFFGVKDAEGFGVKDAEGNDVVKGMFDEEQFLSLEDQYLSRLHGDDDASIQKHKDDMSMPERRSYIAAELISDAGGMFAMASGGDMAAHANKVLRRAKVDDFTQKYFKFSADKFRVMVAGKTRSALERIGITFDAGGDPVRSPLFRDPRKLTEYATGEEGGQAVWNFDSPQGKPITNSPEINRIIAEYVKNKNKLHEHLTVQESDPDGGTAVTAKQILAKDDAKLVQRMASSGMFALNPDGTVKFQSGRPVLLSKKERDMIAEAQSAAIYKVLESVDVPDDQKPFALVRFGEGDESYYRGRYMSREQLDAVMALPDEVLPASIKARIAQLNSGLAKGFDSAGNLVGDPASNLLISYFKATSGSKYTSRAKMNWQVSSPYGWNISRAGNFNLQTFSIARFENKLDRWWGKAGKGNKSYQNFFGLFGGSKDQFRADVIKYLDNQARGIQNPAGPKKDAIFDFLNVADIDNKRMMPDRLSTDARNEHVVPVSLRVDRMAEINPSMGDAMPVNWRRLNANFMPATKPQTGEGAGPEVRYMPATKREKADLPHRVSTRVPTSKKSIENPLTEILDIGLDTILSNPKQAAKHAEVLKEYPGFKPSKRKPEEVIEEFVQHTVDNLLWLHDSVPEATSARSRKWYDGARKIAERMSKEYGIPTQSAAGVLAALSPQMDWFKNVSLAERVIDITVNQSNKKFDKKMQNWLEEWADGNPTYLSALERVKGRQFKSLAPEDQAVFVRVFDEVYNSRDYRLISPEGKSMDYVTKKDGTRAGAGWGSMREIEKGIRIVLDPSKESISNNVGLQHKVRNFYNNILLPNAVDNAVTIDTHAVAAALLQPLAGKDTAVAHNLGGAASSADTGAQGTYGIYAEAYRRAAAQRGILPREMQSITWEAVRGLYSPKFKGNKNNKLTVEKIWKEYENGRSGIEQTRQALLDEAGGITPPDWERLGGKNVAESKPRGDSGKLPSGKLREGRPKVRGTVRRGTDADPRGDSESRVDPSVSYMPAGEERAKIIKEYDGPSTAESADVDGFVKFVEAKQDLLAEIDLPDGWRVGDNTSYHTKWGTAYYELIDPDGNSHKIRIGDHPASPSREGELGKSIYRFELSKPATLESWNKAVGYVEKWAEEN